jgi:ureidoglycolate dehydrogenase (NAD+)
MPFDPQLSHLYGEPYDTPRQVSHFFLAINPAILMDYELFTQRVSQLLAAAKQHSPAAILPGEQETATCLTRTNTGIPLSEQEWQVFNQLAQSQ